MAFLWAAGRGRVGGVLYDSKSAATTMGYPIEDSIGGGLPLYHQRIISRVQEAFPKHFGRPTLPKFRSQPSDEMERQMIRKKEGAEKRICRRPTSWLETIHHGGNRASLFAFALVALYHHYSSPWWVSGDLYARQYGVGCFGWCGVALGDESLANNADFFHCASVPACLSPWATILPRNLCFVFFLCCSIFCQASGQFLRHE